MLQITDQRIINFCQEHPSFSPEKVILFFIDMIEAVGKTTTSSVDHMFTEFSQSLQDTKTAITQDVANTVTNTVKDLSITMLLQMKTGTETLGEMMKMYSEAKDAKLEEKLRSVSVEGVMDQLETIKLMITKEGMNVENVLTKVQSTGMASIFDQLRDIVNGVNPVVMQRLNDIHENHTRSGKSVDDIKGEISKLTLIQSKLEDFQKDWTQFWDRMKKPGARGVQTEIELKLQLENKLPLHEIVHVASQDQKGRMDLNVKREGYPTILIDSKDYTSTVPKTEVDKFERDIMLSGKHGILVSHYSGIANKENFHVSKINNRYAVYLSDIKGDVSDVVNAIKILYYLDSTTEEEDRCSVRIGREEMDKINKLITENIERIKILRSHLTLSLEQCDTMMFDGIKHMLGIKSEQIRPEERVCEGCGKIFKNNGALGNHKRACKIRLR
jgi:hypothetical protein